MRDIDLLGPALVVMAFSGLVFLLDVVMGALWARRHGQPLRATGGAASFVGTPPAYFAGLERPWQRWLPILGLAGLAASLLWSATLLARNEGGLAFGGMLSADRFTLFFDVLFAGIAALVVLASMDYVKKLGGRVGEYYGLVLMASAG